jgi:hypothetical protein
MYEGTPIIRWTHHTKDIFKIFIIVFVVIYMVHPNDLQLRLANEAILTTLLPPEVGSKFQNIFIVVQAITFFYYKPPSALGSERGRDRSAGEQSGLRMRASCGNRRPFLHSQVPEAKS